MDDRSHRQPRQDVHNSEIPVLCQSCEARHRGICGVLPAEKLLQLAKHSSKQQFESQHEIQGEGEKVERYATILRGIVKLSKLAPDGRKQIVGLQFAPDFLGRPFARESGVSVEATTEVRICSFPRAVLDEIVKQSPELKQKLLDQTLRELDEARDWMLTLGRKNASEKLATFLCLLATNLDPERDSGITGPLTFDIPLTRSEIADFLGLTIETVSRQITHLRKAGYIQLENNRSITVPSMERLRQLADGGVCLS
jgi:CRP/FNR family transcriptional regulator